MLSGSKLCDCEIWISKLEVEAEVAETVALFLELPDEAVKEFVGTHMQSNCVDVG